MDVVTLRQIRQAIRADPDGQASLRARDFAGLADAIKAFLIADGTAYSVSFVSRTIRTVAGLRVVTLNLTVNRPAGAGGPYPWTVQVPEPELLARAALEGRATFNAADVADVLDDHPLPDP